MVFAHASPRDAQMDARGAELGIRLALAPGGTPGRRDGFDIEIEPWQRRRDRGSAEAVDIGSIGGQQPPSPVGNRRRLQRGVERRA